MQMIFDLSIGRGVCLWNTLHKGDLAIPKQRQRQATKVVSHIGHGEAQTLVLKII